MKVVFLRQTWTLLSLCCSLQLSAALVPSALPLADSYQPGSGLLLPAWPEYAPNSGVISAVNSSANPETNTATSTIASAAPSSLKTLSTAEQYLVLRNLKRKSADLDRDGVPDSLDPDDDNDGVVDTEDPFPRNAREWLDTDGDGIGNNTDTDDDNDGVPDLLDALPLDPTDSKDSDGDGKGDKTDAYPNDAACDKASNGNGQICFLTMLKDVANDDIHLDKQGLLHIFSREQQQIFRLNPSTGDFLPAVTFRSTVNNPKLVDVSYSAELDQVFVLVNDLEIHSYQPAEGKMDRLVVVDKQLTRLDAIGPYVLLKRTGGSKIYGPVKKTLFECVYSNPMEYIQWEPGQQRLYFASNGQAYDDIRSVDIDPQTGQCGLEQQLSYINDFDFKGPLRLSADGQQLLLGSGHLFNTNEFSWQGRLPVTDMQDAVIRDGHTWLVRNGALEIFDNERKAVAYLPKAGHQVFGLRDMSNQLLVLSRKAQQLGWYFHRNSDVLDDSDGDGVANTLDAFPADPAAAIDTDFDGAPDQWLPGKTAANSNSGLQLDAFPTESLCFAAAHGVNGHCDRDRMMPLFKPDQTAYDNNGILYLYKRERRCIYRWSAASNTFLNPLPVAQLQNISTAGVSLELPASFLLDSANQQIYLHYNRGVITRLSLNDAIERAFIQYPLVANPQLVGSSLLLHRYDKHTYDYVLDVFNQQGQLVSTAASSFRPEIVLYDAIHKRAWFKRRGMRVSSALRIDNILMLLDLSKDGVATISGFNVDIPPFVYRVELGDQLSWTPQNQIMTGKGLVFDNTNPPLRDFTKSHLADLTARDTPHYWVGRNLVQTSNKLQIYTEDSYQPLHQIPLPVQNSQFLPYQHDLVELRQHNGRYQSVYHRIGDADADGLPGWWEQLYGLDDNDAQDAAKDLDLDGLSNLEELQTGSNPTRSDTDDDGISDFDEVRQYGTHPNKADSDQDSIPDGVEISQGLDPLANDTLLDFDADGHNNLEEITLGSLANNADSVPVTHSWLTAQGDNQRRAFTPMVLQPEAFSFKWQRTNSQRIVGIAVKDQQLVVTAVTQQNDAAMLQVLNAATGAVEWQQLFSHPGNDATSSMISAPTISRAGRILLNVDYAVNAVPQDLHSYDLSNGQLLWRHASAAAQDYSDAAPLIEEQTVYLAGKDFSALDVENGQTKWLTPMNAANPWYMTLAGDKLIVEREYPETINAKELWATTPETGAVVDEYLGVYGAQYYEHVIPQSTYPQWGFDGRLFLPVGWGMQSRVLSNLKDTWFKTDVHDDVLDPMPQLHGSLAPGLVFMVSQNKLLQLDSRTGAEHWQWVPPAGQTLIRAVVATSSHVFVSSQDTTYAIDRKTQTMVWSYPKSGLLAVDKQKLLLIQGEHELTAIDLGQ